MSMRMWLQKFGKNLSTRVRKEDLSKKSSAADINSAKSPSPLQMIPKEAGIPIGATAEEMDALNACMHVFRKSLAKQCPKIRIVGLMVGIPNEDDMYGVMIAPGPNVRVDELAHIMKTLGTWMESGGWEKNQTVQ